MPIKEIVKRTDGALRAKKSEHHKGAKHKGHKKGELHHIEIHPAENGFTVEHHTHKGENHDGYDMFGTDKEEHVFENHHKAAKHVKGIMEEHASMSDGLKIHQDGKPIGSSKKESREEDEEGDSGY
jgi:hypothetical protein